MNSAHSYSEGAEVPEDKTPDNELIAEFMEMKYPDGDVHTHYTFKFDISWDWLMSVVEKIENGLEWKYAVLVEHELYSEDSEWNVTIHDAGNATYIEMPPCKSKIEAVYKAVVEFIKWYNLESLKNKPI